MIRLTNNLTTGLILLLFILVDNVSSAQLTEWDLADIQTPRYSPDSFPNLPKDINSYLKSEGYTIPQSYLAIGPHNVISGNFRNRLELDWAVLASKDRVSSILIFWNGSLRKVTSIGKAGDKTYLQEIGNKVIVFSRVIETIGWQKLGEILKKTGQRENVIKEYDGIHDRFLDKSSSLHYYSAGRWYNFVGAD